MSGNRSGKGASTNTFETYRQIAPESLDDQTLRELIKTHNNNHAAISLAIENIWHDIPDQKAVGSEWVTASKSKKDVAPPKPAARRTEGGRGGAGRGRGGPAGGRGNGDGRGDRGGRGERGSKPSSRASPSRATPSPAAAAEDAPTEESVEEVEAPAEPVPAPAPAPIVAAPAVAAVATAPAGPVWGQGMSFAEKLKRAEAEKARLAALPKQEPAPAPATTATAETAPSTEAAAEGPKGRTRGPRRKGGAAAERKEGEAASAAAAAVAEIVAGAEALSVTGAAEKAETVTEAAAPAPEAVAPAAAAAVEAPAAPSVTEGFLKMGKWEAPVEAAEMTAFQFGSFGNAYESSPNNGVSASQVGTNPAAAPWTGLHSAEEKSGSTNVWGAPAEPSLDMSAGLFAQPAAASSGAADSSSAATRAPPGLGPKNNNNNKPSSVGQKPKVDAPQPAAAAAPAQVNNPYAQAYNQPPGMGRGLAAPYAYGGAFDVSQAQFGGYALPTAPVAPAVTTATSSATTTTTTATAQSSSTPAATPAANAQQQPGYPAPFNPYFNPYYGGQFYYGQQQLANFYGQGRDMYQQRGPYPYAGGASLYPDVYGQQVPGQFPDATGNYGMGMPVHPGMQGAAAASNAGNNASGANNNKGGKNANAANNAVGAATTQDQHAANLLMNPAYPYNPYAARGAMDGQGWGYPGTQAGWGNPMMGFPGNPSPTNLGGVGAGFQQQAGASQGQGNNQQGNQQGGRGNYGGRGGAGAAGATLPSGGVAAQGTW